MILGEDFAKDPAKETKVHTVHLEKLEKLLKKIPTIGSGIVVNGFGWESRSDFLNINIIKKQ